jgi:hypothetical protein
LVCEGGKGIDTSCHAVHLAVLEGSDSADRLQRKILKIENDIRTENKAGKKAQEDKLKVQNTVKSLRQNGHPYAKADYNFVYKTIQLEQILDVNALSAAEIDNIRTNGISRRMARAHGLKYPTYVPYYKGQDSDFNRWNSVVEFYIDWSEENVKWMKSNAGKKFTGAPRWQNAKFYFNGGFCWNLIKSDLLQARILKPGGINDSNCMKLSPILEGISEYYICAFLNSKFFNEVLGIVTNTVAVQINDIKSMPIIIPSKEVLQSVNREVSKICRAISDSGSSSKDIRKSIASSELAIEEMFASLLTTSRRVA